MNEPVTDNSGPMERLYRLLWRRAGGRPWTFIAREWSAREPLAWLLLFAGLGAAAAALARRLRIPLWAVVLPFLTGIVVGHIWW